MPQNRPIQTPAGFAPATAVGFADAAGEMVLISAENPLPIASAAPAAATPPLTGSTSASIIAGPFAPVAARPVIMQLDGTWQGTVQLLRSIDSGATKQPVTIAGEPWARFTSNVVEPVWQEAEEGAELHLDLAITSGTIDYRVSQ